MAHLVRFSICFWPTSVQNFNSLAFAVADIFYAARNRTRSSAVAEDPCKALCLSS